MKRIALYLGLATALATSCSIQEEDFKTPQQNEVTYNASFEQPTEEGTRVYANEDLLLRWTADDRVSIFEKNTYNQQFRFTGETGDNAGGFKKVAGDDYYTGNSIPNVVSVYPYLETTKISESGVLTVDLPAEQHYAENTFGLGANTMVSVSADNFLQYKNVGGYLRLSLYGEGVTVSSITLKGNNGEKLAGKASVTMQLGDTPTAVMADDAVTEITLICESPVQLGTSAEESTQFWFVVPPMSFSEGFTVTVNTSSGGMFVKSTTKSISIVRNNLSKMSPMEVVPVSTRKYLAFSSEGATAVSLTNTGDNAPVFYYSFDKKNWTPWDYSELRFTSEQPLYIYGDNPDGIGSSHDKYSFFSTRGNKFSISGDIMSLIDSEHDLTTIPSSSCFLLLFAGCSSLTTAPELPATTLQNYCYEKMFSDCSSLTTAPDLPATNLAWGCYEDMFSSCSSLTIAPELPATKLASYCYRGMFSGCSSLTTAPELPATELASYCYRLMFGGCSSLTTAPELPATTLAESCYSYMFGGCSSLTTAPELPATTLASNCYNMMFTGCSRLDYVKCLATDIDAAGCTTDWLSGVAIVGTFVKASEMINWPRGESGVPERWTVVDCAPVPEAIDLGLLSGIKWASFNLGALQPEEYGDYYAWGETEAMGNWSEYRWFDTSSGTVTKYNTKSDFGIVDNKTVLDLEDDAAHVKWGGSWRIPTNAEWSELRNNCTWTWTTQNGVNGYKVTGKQPGYTDKSIFLPAAGSLDISLSNVGFFGSFWSSSLVTDYSHNAWIFEFNSDYVSQYGCNRHFGNSIRPVSE